VSNKTNLGQITWFGTLIGNLRKTFDYYGRKAGSSAVARFNYKKHREEADISKIIPSYPGTSVPPDMRGLIYSLTIVNNQETQIVTFWPGMDYAAYQGKAPWYVTSGNRSANRLPVGAFGYGEIPVAPSIDIAPLSTYVFEFFVPIPTIENHFYGGLFLSLALPSTFPKALTVFAEEWQTAPADQDIILDFRVDVPKEV